MGHQIRGGEALKNALDQFTEKSATPDQQKATYRFALPFEEMSADVAAARGVSARQLRRLCARSTELTAAEATRARLLSGTRYADENADAVAKEAGTRAKLSLASYHRKIKLQKDSARSASASPRRERLAALDEVAKALPALKDFTGGGSAAAPAADAAAADAAAPPPKPAKPACRWWR